MLELEPAVVQAAAVYREVNFNALANPKVRIVLGDARELLLTLREKPDPLRAFQPVPCGCGQPVHARVLPGGGDSS